MADDVSLVGERGGSGENKYQELPANSATVRRKQMRFYVTLDESQKTVMNSEHQTVLQW